MRVCHRQWCRAGGPCSNSNRHLVNSFHQLLWSFLQTPTDTGRCNWYPPRCLKMNDGSDNCFAVDSGATVLPWQEYPLANCEGTMTSSVPLARHLTWQGALNFFQGVLASSCGHLWSAVEFQIYLLLLLFQGQCTPTGDGPPCVLHSLPWWKSQLTVFGDASPLEPLPSNSTHLQECHNAVFIKGPYHWKFTLSVQKSKCLCWGVLSVNVWMWTCTLRLKCISILQIRLGAVCTMHLQASICPSTNLLIP